MIQTWISQTIACAMCKDIVAGLKVRLADGFFWSILFMLGMPVVVVGVVTWQVARAARRRTR